MRIIAEFHDYMKGRLGSIIIETGDYKEVTLRRRVNDPCNVHIEVGICIYTIQDNKISSPLEEEELILISRSKGGILKAIGPETKQETKIRSGSSMAFGATKLTFFY